MELTKVRVESENSTVHSPSSCCTDCGQSSLGKPGAKQLLVLATLLSTCPHNGHKGILKGLLFHCPEKTFDLKILTIKGKTRKCLKDVERRRKNKDPTHRLRQPGFAGKSQRDERGLIYG